MMRLAKSGEIVRRVIRRVVIQVSNGQAGRDLQTAYCAAFEWIVFIQEAARYGLIAGERTNINHFVFSARALRGPVGGAPE